MITIPPDRLEAAVVAICPDISARVLESTKSRDERTLWHELSCCLLSSQVPYSLAVAAADAIDRNGILFRSEERRVGKEC